MMVPYLYVGHFFMQIHRLTSIFISIYGHWCTHIGGVVTIWKSASCLFAYAGVAAGGIGLVMTIKTMYFIEDIQLKCNSLLVLLWLMTSFWEELILDDD